MITGGLSGVSGRIRWHHYTAAAVQHYAVAPTSKARTTWTLTGFVVNGDPFKLAQRPLVFVATHKKGAWEFPIRSLARDEFRITAVLDAPSVWRR